MSEDTHDLTPAEEQAEDRAEHRWYENEIARLRSALGTPVAETGAAVPGRDEPQAAWEQLGERLHRNSRAGREGREGPDVAGIGGPGPVAAAAPVEARLARIERRLDDIQARLHLIETHPPSSEHRDVRGGHVAERAPLTTSQPASQPKCHDELERS